MMTGDKPKEYDIVYMIPDSAHPPTISLMETEEDGRKRR